MEIADLGSKAKTMSGTDHIS